MIHFLKHCMYQQAIVALKQFEMIDMKTARDKDEFAVGEQAADSRLCYCMLALIKTSFKGFGKSVLV